MTYINLNAEDATPIKAWIEGLEVEPQAMNQIHNISRLSVVEGVAVMPDCHYGIGATVGSVIVTRGAFIPAAVGVDIGCGMVAARTSLTANDLPDGLGPVRAALEAAIPVGGPGVKGSWNEQRFDGVPMDVAKEWAQLTMDYGYIIGRHPKIEKNGKSTGTVDQLGTLGGGNHFIEVCLDEVGSVWVMLHSGSRGVGNRIGTYFINLAKEDMKDALGSLPDKDLAYLIEGTQHFDDYWYALNWAQRFAAANRTVMLRKVLDSLRSLLPEFTVTEQEINCHHNYATFETVPNTRDYQDFLESNARKTRRYSFASEILEAGAAIGVGGRIITRKGAIAAGLDQMGIIPGSMGTKSYIVRGLGNADSYFSASHGAGRRMSRGEAKRTFTLEDHAHATEGVECRKDVGVIDETPGAYKDLDSVMAAESDLVEIVHTLHAVICVKG